ncbi:hypothetical protein [Micromonospora sp. NPDC002717]|uniref:hypothetical protein n=1 Tax=Micromonospora sp. NPDC002717 TaxID=3154424 RepID=UPI0033257044
MPGPGRPPLPYTMTLGLAGGLDRLTRRWSWGLAAEYRRWLAAVLGPRPPRLDEESAPVLAARFLHALWLVLAVLLAVATLPFRSPLSSGGVLAVGVLTLGACVGVVNAALGYLNERGTARLARHPLFTAGWLAVVGVLAAVVLLTVFF